MLESVLMGWVILGVAWLVVPGVMGHVLGALFAVLTFILFWMFAAALIPLIAFFIILPLLQYCSN